MESLDQRLSLGHQLRVGVPQFSSIVWSPILPLLARFAPHCRWLHAREEQHLFRKLATRDFGAKGLLSDKSRPTCRGIRTSVGVDCERWPKRLYGSWGATGGKR